VEISPWLSELVKEQLCRKHADKRHVVPGACGPAGLELVHEQADGARIEYAAAIKDFAR